MRIQLYKVITKVKLDGRPVEGCLLPGTHTHAQTDGQPETEVPPAPPIGYIG